MENLAVKISHIMARLHTCTYSKAMTPSRSNTTLLVYGWYTLSIEWKVGVAVGKHSYAMTHEYLRPTQITLYLVLIRRQWVRSYH